MHKHRSKNGSHVWNRIGKAWKILVAYTYVCGPGNFEEWLATNFWWGTGQNMFGPGFSISRGAQLFNAGLQRNADVWDFDTNTVKSAITVQGEFGLTDPETLAWEPVRRRLNGVGGRWLNQVRNRPIPTEWYGIFEFPSDASPAYVMQGSSVRSLIFPPRLRTNPLA